MALTDENSGIPATMLVGPTGYAGGMPYPVYQGRQGLLIGFLLRRGMACSVLGL